MVANISIRQLDDETVARLRVRAAHHGVSMEEEVRRILKHAVTPPQRITDVFRKHFGQAHGVDLELPRHEPHEPTGIE